MTDNINPFFYDSFSFYTLIPNTSTNNNFSAFIETFQNIIWGALVLCFFAVAFSLSFISELVLYFWNPSERGLSFYQSSTYLIQIILEQSSSYHKHMGILRTLTGPTVILILVISSAYKGMLTSFLTAPNPDSTPTNFEELLHSTYKWITYDSSFYKLVENNEYYEEYVKALNIKGREIKDLGANGCLRLDGPDEVCVGWNYESAAYMKMKYVDAQGTPLRQRSTDELFQTGIGGATIKGSPFTHLLNTAILRMIQSGLYLKWKIDDDELFIADGKKNVSQNKYSDDDQPHGILDSSKFLQIYSILGYGCLISYVVLLFEFILSRCSY